MNNNKELYEKFELYLNNKLSSDEVKELEGLIDGDNFIKEEFLNFKVTLKAIEIYKLGELRTELKKYQQNNIFYRLYKFSYAKAAIILLFIMSVSLIYYLLNSTGINHSKLFDKYFSPYNEEFVTKELDLFENKDKSDAIKFYTQKELSKALPLFKNYLYSNPSDYEAKFYLGICYLDRREPDQAKIIFNEIINSQNQYFSAHAEWYMALSYLKEGNIKATQSILDEIIVKKEYNYEKADTLLREIK